METSKINKSLWAKIQPYYEKKLYSDVLRTVCLFLLDYIREKSEIDKDGEKLIQEVFLSKNPKIIINDYLSESDRDEQRGFGLILQGLICSIRNPISHELNREFNKEMTDSIIIYVNDYILKKLENSKEFSCVEDWFEFIMDKYYNEDIEYVGLILESMSQMQCYNTIINVVDNLYRLEDNNRRLTIKEIVNKLNKKYYVQFIDYLNKVLIKFDDDNNFRYFLSNFPASIWKDLNKIVTIRLEKMIYNSIVDGKAITDDYGNDRTNDGALGTWLNADFLEAFSIKEKILNELEEKLNCDKEQGKYVTRYFYGVMKRNNYLKKEDIIKKLLAGNINYYDLFLDDEEYKSYIEEFVEKEIDPFADFLE